MRRKVTCGLAIATLAILTGLTLFGPEPQACAAALTDGRPSQMKAEAFFPAVVGPVEVYRGGLAAISNGVAYPAANNASYLVVGVFAESVDNQTTAAGYSAARRCGVRQGIFAFDNSTATNAPTRLGVSDVGKPCYVIDDQTVGTASNGYYTVAGTVVYVEPDLRSVWVDVGKVWAGSVPLQTFQLPSSASGLASGRLYVVNTATITNGVGIVP